MELQSRVISLLPRQAQEEWVALQRVLHFMKENEDLVSETQSWHALLLRAQLAQDLWKSVSAEVILYDFPLYQFTSQQVDRLCRRAHELANQHRISEYYDIVDSSVRKLKKKNGVVADITVKEIKAILVCIYKVEPPKGNKIKQVTSLEEEIKKDRPRLFGNEETNLEQTLPLPQAPQEQAKTDLERPVGSAVNL
jgi:hypothetical protein